MAERELKARLEKEKKEKEELKARLAAEMGRTHKLVLEARDHG